MASGTLHTYPENFRAYKILIAAQYSGAQVKVSSDFQLGKTNKSDEFLKKFPLGKVPAFETTDGKCIYESNAIMYYVSNETLHGKNPLDASLVQQYINFADNEILPSACAWTFPTLGIRPFNKQEHEKAVDQIKKCFKVLNDALATKTFLVGERVTLADITVCCNLLLLYKQVCDLNCRAPYVNVNRWFMTCINQPQFKKVIGDFKLCEKMAQFDPYPTTSDGTWRFIPHEDDYSLRGYVKLRCGISLISHGSLLAKKYAELHPKAKGGKDSKETKKKEEKPKQQKKKEEPKPKMEPEHDEEEQEKPKEKPKDPFADLPPTKMVFDEWKRVYSNNDTATVAIPWFWENFDKEGYSIWLAKYQYNEELEMIFMACNLVSGMFQRIEKLRKNAFASIGIFGQNGAACIEGIWVFRGQQLAFDLNEDWNIDAPSYKFEKLDPTNEEHKKIINEYLLWEGDFGGKSFNQGKIFK